jgi:hypothetical protein
MHTLALSTDEVTIKKAHNKMFTADPKKNTHTLTLSTDETTFKIRHTIKCSLHM